MRRWDKAKQKNVVHAGIDSFMADILAVYKRHDMAIGHEDSHGGFVIRPYNKDLERWMNDASFDSREFGGVRNEVCPSCKGPAYRSQSRETMKAILDDPSEKIHKCGVGPWGHVCATNQSASMVG